jgi:hypothetical protein
MIVARASRSGNSPDLPHPGAAAAVPKHPEAHAPREGMARVLQAEGAPCAPGSQDGRRPLSAAYRGRGNQAVLRMLNRNAGIGARLERRCSCEKSGGGSGQCAECAAKNRLERSAKDRAPISAVPPIVHQVLRSAGQPIDTATRAAMERRFGYDFAGVRFHIGSEAEQSAAAVNALAYTVGHHVVFGAGQYSPHTDDGRRLIAHELAHVVQQRDWADSGARPDRISSPNDAGEQEAERAAGAVMAGLTVEVPAQKGVLSRYGHSDCSEDDLRNFVWPSDWVTKQMVAKAIRVLGADPLDPAVPPLLTKYFMTATPNLARIREVYNSIQADFTANNYTYECETECDEVEAAYVRARLRYIGVLPNIHLCMAVLRGYERNCIASIILHEFSHYSAHTDDKTGCYVSCDTNGCGAGFSASDALDNASSYANFALELFTLAI